jgi:hypothetical protein
MLQTTSDSESALFFVMMFHKNSPMTPKMFASSNLQTVIINIDIVCHELTI